jgi:phage terminase small subunit
MPILENARHERLAQELAQGKSATEAHKIAYGSKGRTSGVSGSRMLKNVEIKRRVAELQGKAAEKTVITVEGLISEADELKLLAIKQWTARRNRELKANGGGAVEEK